VTRKGRASASARSARRPIGCSGKEAGRRPARDKLRIQRGIEGRKGAAGFGLIELLVAITVASIVLVGAGVAQSVCFELNRTSQETLTAVSDLDTAMEAIRLLPLQEIPAAEGPYAPGQSIAAFEDLHLENERIVATYPGYDGGGVPDPLEIRLTVTFDDHAGRPRSLSIASLRTR
jgi:prepilin-type N-terminal cleavage/methylation domain-containing protein